MEFSEVLYSRFPKEAIDKMLLKYKEFEKIGPIKDSLAIYDLQIICNCLISKEETEIEYHNYIYDIYDKLLLKGDFILTQDKKKLFFNIRSHYDITVIPVEINIYTIRRRNDDSVTILGRSIYDCGGTEPFNIYSGFCPGMKKIIKLKPKYSIINSDRLYPHYTWLDFWFCEDFDKIYENFVKAENLCRIYEKYRDNSLAVINSLKNTNGDASFEITHEKSYNTYSMVINKNGFKISTCVTNGNVKIVNIKTDHDIYKLLEYINRRQNEIQGNAA